MHTCSNNGIRSECVKSHSCIPAPLAYRGSLACSCCTCHRCRGARVGVYSYMISTKKHSKSRFTKEKHSSFWICATRWDYEYDLHTLVFPDPSIKSFMFVNFLGQSGVFGPNRWTEPQVLDFEGVRKVKTSSCSSVLLKVFTFDTPYKEQTYGHHTIRPTHPRSTQKTESPWCSDPEKACMCTYIHRTRYPNELYEFKVGFLPCSSYRLTSRCLMQPWNFFVYRRGTWYLPHTKTRDSRTFVCTAGLDFHFRVFVVIGCAHGTSKPSVFLSFCTHHLYVLFYYIQPFDMTVSV